uniref:Glutathione transferase n=1 Tax=Rhabditophanes sp. KR3021 TaxID=114890 RepID=A0AC35UE35_9BILA
MVGELSNVVVNYFDVMGKAEVIRILLGYNGQTFKDNRVPHDDTWPAIKEKLTLPFGQMPTLEFELDGKKEILAQSRAIELFLAKHFGLLPECEVGVAKVLQYCLGIDDLTANFRPLLLEQDVEKKGQIMKVLINDHVKPFLVRYDAFLKSNGTGFLVGKKLSVADLALYQFLWLVINKFNIELDVSLVELSKFFERIGNDEKLKKYIESRPDTKW